MSLSTEKVLQMWSSVADLLETLAAHGAAARRRRRGKSMAESTFEDLMVYLAAFDLASPASANTWRILLQKQVSTTAVLAVACERRRSWLLLAPSASGILSVCMHCMHACMCKAAFCGTWCIIVRCRSIGTGMECMSKGAVIDACRPAHLSACLLIDCRMRRCPSTC
jgi:hypothetical protein